MNYELKFPVDINPFGMLYNPASIKNCIEQLIQKKQFMQSDLHFYDEQWHSFSHHGSFSNMDADMCLKTINKRIKHWAIRYYPLCFVKEKYHDMISELHEKATFDTKHFAPDFINLNVEKSPSSL